MTWPIEIIKSSDGCPHKTTGGYCRKRNLKSKCLQSVCPIAVVPCGKYLETRDRDMLTLFNHGATPAQIAERFDMTAMNVRGRLKIMGAKMRPHGGRRTGVKWPREKYERFMQTEGTFTELAAMFGVSAPTAAKIKRGYVPEFTEGSSE